MHGILCTTAVVLLTALLAVPANAQEGVTLVMDSGEKVSGQLVDMGASGLDVKVGGEDKQYPVSDVAVIDFAGSGSFPAEEGDKAAGGNHVLVTRDGAVHVGKLYDVGGTRPLRISFTTDGSTRDFTSNEVARIYFEKPAAGGAAAAPGVAQQSGPGRIQVPAAAGWVNTGLMVSDGQQVSIATSGEVRLSADGADVATPAGSKQGRYSPNAPLPSALAGALIGRVGNGEPFGIGNQTSFPAPASGLLFLAVNDDNRGDNSGAYSVDVAVQPGLRRR